MANAPRRAFGQSTRLPVEKAARGDAAGAGVARAPVGERRDLHPGAAVRRVNEAPVADVHPDVPESAEEDEVARLQPPAPDPPAEVEVRVRAVRQDDAEPL